MERQGDSASEYRHGRLMGRDRFDRDAMAHPGGPRKPPLRQQTALGPSSNLAKAKNPFRQRQALDAMKLRPELRHPPNDVDQARWPVRKFPSKGQDCLAAGLRQESVSGIPVDAGVVPSPRGRCRIVCGKKPFPIIPIEPGIRFRLDGPGHLGARRPCTGKRIGPLPSRFRPYAPASRGGPLRT